MNILDELKALQQAANITREPQPTTGDSYISDVVLYSALYRAGVEEDVIKDVLLEPVENRGDWINYFETVGKK